MLGLSRFKPNNVHQFLFLWWKRNTVRSSRVITGFLKYTIQPSTGLSGRVSVSEDFRIICKTEAVNSASGFLQISGNYAPPKKRKRTGQSNETAILLV